VVVLAALLVFAFTPALLLAAAVASPFLPGRLRALRILVFALVYLALETVLLVVLGVLWLAAGCGRRLGGERMQRTHYRLLGWFLRVLMGTARRAFNLRIEVHGSAPPPLPRVALIVLARHAGPGDSFLLVHELLNAECRRPRIVLKDALQRDSLIDIALNRLPAHFVSASAPTADAVGSIAELAAGMGPDDALLIFPEGGNFTERRRRRSIAKLEELGRHEEAHRARELRHLLGRRAGGADGMSQRRCRLRCAHRPGGSQHRRGPLAGGSTRRRHRHPDVARPRFRRAARRSRADRVAGRVVAADGRLDRHRARGTGTGSHEPAAAGGRAGPTWYLDPASPGAATPEPGPEGAHRSGDHCEDAIDESHEARVTPTAAGTCRADTRPRCPALSAAPPAVPGAATEEHHGC
jgi:1-acyl-sn-glycerol-3-phosphate acyltransferase